MNFTDRLQDWTDMDLAMHEIALQLGLVPKDASYSQCVGHYWGGKYYLILRETLEKLAEIGLLEYNEDDLKFRANKNFLNDFDYY